MPEVERAHAEKYAADLVKTPGHNHSSVSLFRDDAHAHARPKICVSGAAETGHCGINAYEQGKDIGREIVRQGAILVTGATTGMPLYASVGAKEEGGFTIGFSPAASEREHVETYNLPLDYSDIIVYTGFGFPGRDLLLTRSADAVVIGCGRVGTIHEFTIAFEDKKPIGILEGCWETDDIIKKIVEASHRPHDQIIFEKDPHELIRKILEHVQKNKLEQHYVYKNYDGWSGTKGDRIL